MSHDELREALGRKFVELFLEQMKTLPNKSGLMALGDNEGGAAMGLSDPDTYPNMYGISFLPLADECIRQMKFAREQGILWCEEQDSYSWGRPGESLALAPKDWKP